MTSNTAVNRAARKRASCYLRRCASKQRLLPRRRFLSLCQQLALRLSPRYPLAGNVEVFSVPLNAGEILARLGTGHACGSATHEGVANRLRALGKAQAPGNNPQRLLRRGPNPLGIRGGNAVI